MAYESHSSKKTSFLNRNSEWRKWGMWGRPERERLFTWTWGKKNLKDTRKESTNKNNRKRSYSI